MSKIRLSEDKAMLASALQSGRNFDCRLKKKILLMLVLLCAAAQGAWADDGWSSASSYDKDSDADKPTHYDTYGGRSDVHVIKTAANYLYVMDKPADYCNKNIYLDINVDVSSKTWINLDDILGVHRYLESWGSGYRGTFYGNGHTIRINLDYESYSSYKGPFGIIAEGGKVQDLNVEGTIYLKKMDDGNGTDFVGGICGENNGTIENCSVSASVSSEENYLGGITGRNTGTGTISNCRVSGNVSSDSRLVGGIAGENNGTISNCWVSGNVSSDWKNSSVAATAKVGGIAGENNSTVEYCCMTGNVSNDDADVGGIAGDNVDGTIKHCTFYGTRSSDHSQDNLYAGDSGTEDNCYDGFNTGEWDAAKANGHDLYAYAIKYPYAINVTTVGQGSVTVSADGEDNIPGTRHQQEVTLTTPSGLNADVTVTDADGNTVTLFGNSSASGYTFNMRRPYVNVHVIFSVPDWPRQGSGTTDSPYLITSADDWNEFALSVNAGINHSGKHVKLTNDISIWMMAGASKTNSFQGTFDGDGHTLTFNCNNTTSAVTAPFRYTKNAIIKNLRTAGSIATNAMNAAGIVGDVTGSLSLTNCCSAVTISSSRSDADFHGGLVASNNGSVTISGCVFDGSFVATVAHTNQYGTTYCGGFVGYCGSNSSTTITNSLVATTSVSEGMVSHTFVVTNDGAVLSFGNSYFVTTTNLPTNQGQQAHTISAGDDVTISDIGEATTTYGSDGITVYENGIKYRDTFFVVSGKTVSLTLSHGDKMGYHFSQYAASAGTISAQTETSATLTMPAANITISAEWTKFIDGTGTADDPYVIDNADKWNYFANSVTGGYTFSGEFVKLGANVSVTDMAGTSDANSFQGTFDGDGQTLTFTKGTSAEPFAEEYCAPFRHVKNAVIKNLHVAGTIYTSAKKAAGFVGESHGALTLTGCISSVNINSSIGNDGTHGGLVSTLSGSGNTVTIDGCVFDGSFATTNGTNNCGGFIGWPVYNTPVIKNSLMIPSSVDAGMLNNTFARWHSTYEPTIDNCYYVATTNLPTDQGTAAYATATAPANLGSLVEDYGMVEAYANGILVGGTYYVAPATVTLADGSDNNTAISSADGCVANVTLSGRKLYKDGAWNTLCLPFDVTIAGSPLAGATARALTSATIEGTTLTLTFGDAVTTLEAGTPYIIKWTADANYVDDDEHNIVSPVFSGITIDKTDRSYDNNASGDLRVRFMGTYKSQSFTAEDKSILLMGGNNTLYYPQSGAGIGAQRAYFKIGDDGALLARRLTAFNIDFGDDEATGIISTTNYTNDTNSDAWFTLDGRRLSAKPSRAGVYINNGIKVVIK